MQSGHFHQSKNKMSFSRETCAVERAYTTTACTLEWIYTEINLQRVINNLQCHLNNPTFSPCTKSMNKAYHLDLQQGSSTHIVECTAREF